MKIATILRQKIARIRQGQGEEELLIVLPITILQNSTRRIVWRVLDHHLDVFEDSCEDVYIAEAYMKSILRSTIEDEEKNILKFVSEKCKHLSEVKAEFGRRYSTLNKQEEASKRFTDLKVGEFKRD